MKQLLFILLALGTVAPIESVKAQPSNPGYSLSSEDNIYWPSLKRGAQSYKVKTLLLLLNNNGSRLTVDGRFGASTESAVRRFQKSQQLTVDGIVGAETWEELVVPMQRGLRGPAVKIFQGLLIQNGQHLKQDGVFGIATEKAVNKFMKKKYGQESATKKGEVYVWCYLLGGMSAGD